MQEHFVFCLEIADLAIYCLTSWHEFWSDVLSKEESGD